ncbi:MAG: hypothetical protein ACRDSH_16225 [Pseudonocardiaceae bacterium]
MAWLNTLPHHTVMCGTLTVQLWTAERLWTTREWHSVLEHCYALTSVSTSSRTRWASAWPPVAFLTAPTIAPAAAT